MKRKILIISYSYPPANAPAAGRPYSIAKYLDKEKYLVTVLTCANQDSSLGFSEEFEDSKDLGINLIKVKGINISKFRSFKPASDNNSSVKSTSFLTSIKTKLARFLQFFLFPDRAVVWLPFALFYVIRHRKSLKSDIILSTSPAYTNHVLAWSTRKLLGIKNYIVDIRDFHYAYHIEKEKGFNSYLHGQLEKLILKSATKVTVVSKSMRDLLVKRYGFLKNKTSIIYNGFEGTIEQEPDLKKGEKLVIAYAGSFYGGKRNPLHLINALSYLVDEGKININNIEIRIAGSLDTFLLSKLENSKIGSSIKYLGMIDRSEVNKLYESATVLWMIVGDDINHYTTIPLKFFEYSRTGKPIICFAPANAEICDLIQNIGNGWNFVNSSSSIEHNTVILSTIYNLWKEDKLVYKKLDHTLLSNFSRKNQTRKLQELIEACAS